MHDKNISNAPISTESGNIHIGDNILFEAAQFKTFSARLRVLSLRHGKKIDQIDLLRNTGMEQMATELSQELDEISKEISETSEKLDQLKSAVRKLVEDFRSIPIDTERLAQARAYFDAGKFVEARAVFDSQLTAMAAETRLIKETKASLQSEISEVEYQLASKSNEYLILAKLTAIDFDNSRRVEQVESYLQLALDAAESGTALFTYALFLRHNGRYDEAFRLYNSTVRFYRKQPLDSSEYKKGLAAILNSLGGFYFETGEYFLAKEALLETLSLCESISNTSDIDALKNLGVTLSVLGGIEAVLGNVEQAESHLRRSIQVLTTAIDTPSGFDIGALAVAHNNLGELSFKLGNYEESKASFSASIRLYQSDRSNESVHMPALARALGHISKVHLTLGEFDLAFAKCEAGLMINEELSRQNPSAYLKEYAASLGSIAHLHSEAGNASKAEPLFCKAIATFNKLVKLNRPAHLESLALSMNNYGAALKKAGRGPESEHQFITALSHWFELDNIQSKVYDLRIAMTAVNLGALNTTSGNRQESTKYADLVMTRASPYQHRSAEAKYYLSIAELILDHWQTCST